MWFLSALIWSSTIIFATRRTFKHTATSWIIPIIVFVGYTFLLNYEVKWNLEKHAIENVVIYPRMLRGVCGIGLGYMLGYLLQHNRISNKITLSCMNVVSIMAFLIVILAEFATNSYDNYVLLAFPIIIIACIQKESLFNRIFRLPILTSLGKISFDMFLIHNAVIKVYLHMLQFCDLPLYASICLYVVLVTLAGYAFDFCFRLVYKSVNNR